MAGYSPRSLIDKLGIKPNMTVCFLHAPENYHETLGSLPHGVTQHDTLVAQADFIHFFTQSKDELETWFPRLKKNLAFDGTLWVSWPKGSSKVKTDLNENGVMQIGLANGLVDVKVAAIDDVWSGLKFVYRLKDRQ